MGCTNVIAVTDHQPLIGIFGDRDLSKIQNPRLFKLKEKSLSYFFIIQHCPGKWLKDADAISCNPVATVEALLSLYPTQPSVKDIHLSENIDAAMELATIQAVINSSNDVAAMSPDNIHASGQNDQSYMTLINTINQGFPTKHSLTEPEIYDFWEVRHRLSTERDLVLMNRRIVVPKSLKGKVLNCLYRGHESLC